MKSNCHRLFLQQFEMAQETGTCMRVFKVKITAARQTHFPLVIPPLKPSILDSTAVIGKQNKTKQNSVAQKITCKSHFVKIVLKNMISMIGFPKTNKNTQLLFLLHRYLVSIEERRAKRRRGKRKGRGADGDYGKAH